VFLLLIYDVPPTIGLRSWSPQ